MQIGDIVLYSEKRWKVLSTSGAFRTCQLASFDGSKAEVPDDLDQRSDGPPQLKVLYNPAVSWPFTAIPLRAKAGPITSVFRGSVSLGPLVDWVPSDFLRPGGTIFFNPALKLRTGEILAVVHQDQSRSRISITPNFGTIQARKHRADNPIKVQGPKNSFELLSEDPFGDET